VEKILIKIHIKEKKTTKRMGIKFDKKNLRRMKFEKNIKNNLKQNK
jgi:hypothetical protein